MCKILYNLAWPNLWVAVATFLAVAGIILSIVGFLIGSKNLTNLGIFLSIPLVLGGIILNFVCVIFSIIEWFNQKYKRKDVITVDEIIAINRQFGGITTLTGDASTVLANAALREGFWHKVATIIRDIAGRHMFNDANKRTTQVVVEELVRRNGITTGVSSDQIRRIIQQVASGELREVEDIARTLRRFSPWMKIT